MLCIICLIEGKFYYLCDDLIVHLFSLLIDALAMDTYTLSSESEHSMLIVHTDVIIRCLYSIIIINVND